MIGKLTCALVCVCLNAKDWECCTLIILFPWNTCWHGPPSDASFVLFRYFSSILSSPHMPHKLFVYNQVVWSLLLAAYALSALLFLLFCFSDPVCRYSENRLFFWLLSVLFLAIVQNLHKIAFDPARAIVCVLCCYTQLLIRPYAKRPTWPMTAFDLMLSWLSWFSSSISFVEYWALLNWPVY